eukprot:TRINITY_DN3186_c0_g1_i2.p1 TRINITY_DN3186_c0_g1~~TRINITY_DN3186_c0_g1_i2.p1  ORF type:complete len:465 (-),score=63.21 TRINITY_DN3186_c0_g1_i2:19-1290(-)
MEEIVLSDTEEEEEILQTPTKVQRDHFYRAKRTGRSIVELLPRDIILSIVFFLTRFDIARFARTCKKIRIITYSDLIWKNLSYSRWRLDISFIEKSGQIHKWRDFYMRRITLDEGWHPSPSIIGKGSHYNIKTLSHSAGVNSVDSKGRFIASGSADFSLRIWDMETKQPLERLEGHTDQIRTVKFGDSQGLSLASGSADKTIRVYNFDRNTKKHVSSHLFRGHTAAVSSLDFHSNQIVSGSWDKTIRIWDVVKGVTIRTLKTNSVITQIEFVENSMVSSHRDGTIKLWDKREHNVSMTLKGHTKAVLCHHFDQYKLVSGGEDKSLKWWDIRKGNIHKTKYGNEEYSSVFFDSESVWTTNWAGNLEIFSNSDQNLQTILKEHNSSISSFCLNGMNMITGSLDKTVKVWQINPCLLYTSPSPRDA